MRYSRREFIVMSAAAAALSGCRLPGSPSNPSDAESWRAGFDRSGSALSDAPFYSRQTATLVDHLRDGNGTLAGAAITGDTVADADWVVNGDFSVPSGKTQNAVDRKHAAEAKAVQEQIADLLRSPSPHSGSDILGFLQIAAERKPTDIAVFSDGYNRGPSWDAYDGPLDRSDIDRLVRALRRDDPVDLGGARVFFVGPGRSNSASVGGTKIDRRLEDGVKAFWHQYIRASNGVLVSYASELKL
jgi:hypothetical protein